MLTKDTKGKTYVYAFGCNAHGKLGLGTSEECVFTPRLIDPKCFNNENVLHIAAGKEHSLFATAQNVYACGYNKYGQLGVWHLKPVHKPEVVPGCQGRKILKIAVGGCRNMVFSQNSRGTNTMAIWGTEIIPYKPGTASYNSESCSSGPFHFDCGDMEDMAVGTNHFLVITGQGEVHCFGNNRCGQLGPSNKKFIGGYDGNPFVPMLNPDGCAVPHIIH
jgi:alpha-tubulin suppressor-like RCC1 family protein